MQSPGTLAVDPFPGLVEVHRSLTGVDLLLCLVPVAVFLSIVSLV